MQHVLLLFALIPSLFFTAESFGASEEQQDICLSADTKNIGAIALACSTVLQQYRIADETPPDEVLNRIKTLQPTGNLHEQFKHEILNTMVLNRRAFQSKKVLKRYDEKRLLPDESIALEQCGQPLNTQGTPLLQYPVSFSKPEHSAKSIYSESNGVLGCLATTSGLASIRAEPLAQHYYCTFPGISPEIRSCFTFQIRVSSSTRSNTYKNIPVESGGTVRIVKKAKKSWLFAGSDKDFMDARKTKTIPKHLIEKAFTYCSVDGRAAKISERLAGSIVNYWNTAFFNHYLDEVAVNNDVGMANTRLIKEYLDAKDEAKISGISLRSIDEIDPVRDINNKVKPPLCWVNKTQPAIFQLMLSPALTLYFDRDNQLALIKNYYQCDKPSVKQAYRKIDGRLQRDKKKRMKNFCPDNFDHWSKK